MRIFTEKEAEDFLEKQGFKIIERTFIRKKRALKKLSKTLQFPWAMKVSGRRIIHKNRVKGIILGVGNLDKAIKAFKHLRKIKGCEEVIIQKQINGKEFLLGIKKTPEFGHAIVFGAGGIHTEELNDVSFRICPINVKDVKEMIKEVKFSKCLKKESTKEIEKNLIKLCNLVKKFPRVKELDINPLMVGEKNAIVVDARIAWE